MSDNEEYASFFTQVKPTPPGKQVVKKAKKVKERKDNVVQVPNNDIPPGYTEAVINGMNVLVKKPTSAVVQKIIEPPIAAAEGKVAGAKKPRAKTAWSEFIRLNGMVARKNTEAYNQFMEQYRQFKEAFDRKKA
jgi:hypothetical protein